MINFCCYGCGQEAKFKFKNGKWCCCSSHNKCENIKNKNTGNTGHKCTDEKKEKIRQGNTGKIISEKTKHLISISSKIWSNSENGKKILSNNGKMRKGKKLKLWSEDQKNKLREKRLGKNNPMFGFHHSDKTKSIIGLNSSKLKHTDEFKEKMRQRMLNGGHEYVSSFITKISKEEKELREMVKNLYSNCIYQFKIFRYEIDVAIPEYKIAIEYDGWYHFDSEEHKQYHKFRQERIEGEGWKFLRYNIFQKFPTLDQIEKDLNEIIKGY
jgi:very-short-patch-repair endonuclease